jgi:tRNA(fMet)-specific endonuclease VapC
MGLIVDTSITIRSARRGESVQQLIETLIQTFGPIPVAQSAVSAVELTHGIYRGKREEDKLRRRLFAEELFRDIPVVATTLEIARLAGRIDGEQAAKGITIDFQDLIIGATALYLGYDILTLNVRHFQAIPGLQVRTL